MLWNCKVGMKISQLWTIRASWQHWSQSHGSEQNNVSRNKKIEPGAADLFSPDLDFEHSPKIMQYWRMYFTENIQHCILKRMPWYWLEIVHHATYPQRGSTTSCAKTYHRHKLRTHSLCWNHLWQPPCLYTHTSHHTNIPLQKPFIDKHLRCHGNWAPTMPGCRDPELWLVLLWLRKTISKSFQGYI